MALGKLAERERFERGVRSSPGRVLCLQDFRFNAEKAAPKGGFQIKADKSASYWVAGQDLNL
jgi:hypothetical protein